MDRLINQTKSLNVLSGTEVRVKFCYSFHTIYAVLKILPDGCESSENQAIAGSPPCRVLKKSKVVYPKFLRILRSPRDWNNLYEDSKFFTFSRQTLQKVSRSNLKRKLFADFRTVKKESYDKIKLSAAWTRAAKPPSVNPRKKTFLRMLDDNVDISDCLKQAKEYKEDFEVKV